LSVNVLKLAKRHARACACQKLHVIKKAANMHALRRNVEKMLQTF
jgi:hypothetical protein